MIWRPGTSPFLFRKPGAGGGSSVPVPTVYWEADYGVVTTTNGTTADASPVSGNKVLSWTSKDGSAKVINNATNINRPTYYAPAYGRPYITFDSTVNYQWLAGNNIANAFDNQQTISMGVALRRPGAYAGNRNEPYVMFNPGWAGTNSLTQGSGSYPRFSAGADPIQSGPGGTLGAVASRDFAAETTFFGTYSTTATSQSGASAAAATAKIYINGTLNATATGTASKTTTSYGGNYIVAVGNPTGGGVTAPSARDYYGVYLYQTELSASQVAAAHNDISSRLFSWITLPVAGASLWLDASRPSTLWDTTALGSNVYTNGGAIGQWNDLSGNARHAQQASSANRPTWASPANGFNGLGIVAFNGTSSSIAFSALSSMTNFTVYFVANNNDLTNGSVVAYGGTGTSNYLFLKDVIRAELTGGSTTQIDKSCTNDTSYKLATIKYNGTTGVAYNNGVSGTTKTTTSNLTLSSLGSYSSATYYLYGNIAEFIVYPSSHSDTDRTSVESYLKSKWGL